MSIFNTPNIRSSFNISMQPRGVYQSRVQKGMFQGPVFSLDSIYLFNLGLYQTCTYMSLQLCLYSFNPIHRPGTIQLGNFKLYMRPRFRWACAPIHLQYTIYIQCTISWTHPYENLMDHLSPPPSPCFSQLKMHIWNFFTATLPYSKLSSFRTLLGPFFFRQCFVYPQRLVTNVLFDI